MTPLHHARVVFGFIMGKDSMDEGFLVPSDTLHLIGLGFILVAAVVAILARNTKPVIAGARSAVAIQLDCFVAALLARTLAVTSSRKSP